MPDSIGTAFVDVAFDPKQIEGQVAGLGSKVTSGFGKLGSLGGAAMVTGIGAAVAAGVAVGKYLYDVGEQFDEMADSIRIATGRTGKDLDALVKTAKTVGTDVPTSFEDAGKAVGYLSNRLDLTGKPLRTMSDQLLEVSRLTKTDLQGNMEAAAAALSKFGVPAAESSAALDKLWRASQAAQVPFADLAKELARFGTPLQAFGFNLDQSAALLDSFHKAGVNVQSAMGGLTKGLASLAKAGKDPVEGLRDTVEQIKNAGSSADATGIAVKLFGTRAGPELAKAIRSGALSFDDLQKKISGGRETILKAGEDTADFSEQWQLFKNRVAVGVAPVAEKMFSAIGDGMALLNKEMPKLSKELGDELGPALEDLGPAFDEIGDAIKSLTPVWKILGELVVSTMRVMIVSIKAFADILAGTIKVISGLLHGDFGQAWEGAKQIVSGFADYFKALLQAGVLGLLTQMLGPIKTAATNLGKGIYDGIVAGVGAITGFITTTTGAIASALTSAIGAVKTAATNVGRAIYDGVVAGVTGIGTFVAGVYNGFVSIASGAVGAVKSAATAVGKGLYDGVVAGLTGIGAFVANVFHGFETIASGVVGEVKTAAAKVGKAIYDGISGAITGIGGEVSRVVGGLANTISGFVGKVTSAAHDIGSAIFHGITGSVGDIAGAVWSALNNVYNTIKGWLDKLRSIASSVGGVLSNLNPLRAAPLPPEGGGEAPAPAAAARAGLGVAPAAATGTTMGAGTMYGQRSPFAGLASAIRAASGTVPAIAPAATVVRVFIGDQELRGIVRTEVAYSDDQLARTLLAGATR
jgi:TP901 family phage tail tape measure protein